MHVGGGGARSTHGFNNKCLDDEMPCRFNVGDSEQGAKRVLVAHH